LVLSIDLFKMVNVKFLENNCGVHGVVEEIMSHPPEGITYTHFRSNKKNDFISVPIVEDDSADLIEAFDTFTITKKDWIYNGSNFSQLASFDLFGTYLSRSSRLQILEKILEKDNCKKIIFPSKAGSDTLFSYGNMKNKAILEKCAVVPYAFRKVDDSFINKERSDKVKLLFIGSQFIRKGGRQVADAFEVLNKKYDDLELNIVSNFAVMEKFTDKEDTLAIKARLSNMKNVNFLSRDRNDVLDHHYPDSDIFVLPTFWESFGFVFVEAMAYGLPVVSTDWPVAVPEIVEDNKSGFLIKIMGSDFMKAVENNTNKYNFGGFYMPDSKFHKYLVNELVDKLSLLIEDSSLRKKMGLAGLNIARSKFSFEKRNKIMKAIYEEAAI